MCGNINEVQPVEFTIIVSSGIGSAVKMYLNAAASGQPAQSECSSRISFLSVRSEIPRFLVAVACHVALS